MSKKIKVLIVDDSAVVRQTMTELLTSDKEIEVIAAASDPYYAAEKIKKELPDVITLDVEMPRMDGLTFLHKIMSQHPIPVVMCSSLVDTGSETLRKALEYGAVDIISKPKVGVKQFLDESRIILCDSVKAAAKANLTKLKPRVIPKQAQKKLTADAMLAKPKSKAMIRTTEKIVVVGASTGGTEALYTFLKQFPRNCPGIVIVQHMPEKFTSSFATRLNNELEINVKEAVSGDSVIPGLALIAPGNFHMLLKRSGARYYVEIKSGPLVSRHRPSVDVLFRSAARYGGSNCIGIIMTGMGDDGAKGLKEMHDAGAETIAQNEQSCVVFGMPAQAIKLDAADHILDLNRIADKVITIVNKD